MYVGKNYIDKSYDEVYYIIQVIIICFMNYTVEKEILRCIIEKMIDDI